MTNGSVVAIAVGNEGVAARFGLQHVRKIFRAHGWLLGLHLVGADDVGHHLAAKLGLGGAVDGGRVVALEGEVRLHAKRGAELPGHLAHALLDQVKHC